MAVDFKTSSTNIELGTFDLNEDECTIAAWFWVYADNWYDSRIISKGVSSTNYDWMLGYTSSDNIKHRLGVQNYGIAEINQGSYNEETDYHTAYTFNETDGEVKAFVDGTQEGSTIDVSSGWGCYQSSRDVWLGDNATDRNRDHDGYIYEIRIYDRRLEQDELQTLHACKGRDCLFAGIDHRYLMNEKHPGQAVSGTDTVKDWTGKDHGSQTNATYQPDYMECNLSWRRRML